MNDTVRIEIDNAAQDLASAQFLLTMKPRHWKSSATMVNSVQKSI